MKSSALLAILFVLGCAGCGSGIEISHVSSSDKSLTGVPWDLAMTQFKLTITRQISACDGELKGSVTVAATAGKVLDPAQKYLLDSTGWWATSDITSNIATDGTSTGLNAQSQDVTAQVITSIVSLGAEAAIFAGGAARTPTPSAAAGPKYTCANAVEAALQDMHPPGKPSLAKEVDAETTALSNATNRVTLLTAQALKDRSYSKLLAKALGEQATAQATLTRDQTRLTKDQKAVTDIQTVSWPQQADQFRADDFFKLPDATLSKWIKWANVPIGSPPPTLPDKSMFDVSLALYRGADDGSWVPPSAPAVGDVSIGIPVRVARPGRLLICTGSAPCPQSLASGWVPTDPHSVAVDQPVLQLGQMYNVRVRGGLFKSEGAVIALDPNGQPTSIEVSEKAAAGATATGAASSAATTVAGIPTAIAALQLARAQALSAQITAENAQITYQANAPTAAATAAALAQTAAINAQNGLASAQAVAPNVVPTAVAQAQTALYNAQTAVASAQASAQNAGPAAALAAQTSLLQAQNTVATLEANEPNTDQVDALTAQTALLSAQAAQINAQVALTSAQAALSP